jgi:DNA-binding response OmpR family regulator
LGNAEVGLTVKEFDLLHELMRGNGNVITREALMQRVWGYDSDAVSRTLDTHVRRLREKLGPASSSVETIRGIGYRIAVEGLDSA